MSYKVDYQSGGIETSPSIPGKTTIDLPQSVVDATSTSLTLTGKGVPNYGEIQQENFIRLLENFASKTAPSHPTVGQAWYDTVSTKLKVYGIDQTWHLVGGVLPSSTQPSAPQLGDMWFDNTTTTLKVWNGTQWTSVGGGGQPSATAPANPQTGQLWFDTSSGVLKVYDASTSTWTNVGAGQGVTTTATPPTAGAASTVGSLWWSTSEKILYVRVDNSMQSTADQPLYFNSSWAQVWPSVTRYASYNEYNALATRINRVIGAPSTSGSAPDPADNQWGWGQTDTLEVFTNMNTPSQFDNVKWTILLSRLKKALRHTAAADNTGSIGFIYDGRGSHATANAYSPNVNWVAGWSGYGIQGIVTNWNALTAGVDALEANRFSPNAASMNISSLRSDATTGTWASTRQLDLTFTFASNAAAYAFFNQAGSARFTISLTDGAGVGHEWYNTIVNAGLNTSGIVLDYTGTKIGFNGAYNSGGTTTYGFYDLNTTARTIASFNRSGAYGTGSLVVNAVYNSATAKLTVSLIFNEDYAAGQVISKVTVATDVRVSAATVAGLPYIDTPAVVVPSVSAAGTFLSAAAGT
jgi:hypothetical protein